MAVSVSVANGEPPVLRAQMVEIRESTLMTRKAGYRGRPGDVVSVYLREGPRSRTLAGLPGAGRWCGNFRAAGVTRKAVDTEERHFVRARFEFVWLTGPMKGKHNG